MLGDVSNDTQPKMLIWNSFVNYCIFDVMRIQLKKLLHHKEYHLIIISDGKVFFEYITKHRVENSFADDYRYLKYKGQLFNDIVDGLSYEFTHTSLTDFKSYEKLQTKLVASTLINDEKLSHILPFSVKGDYYNPL